MAGVLVHYSVMPQNCAKWALASCRLLLLLCSATEIISIVITVTSLQNDASRTFEIDDAGRTWHLCGRPRHLLLSHGYLSIAAAALACSFPGILRYIAIFLRGDATADNDTKEVPTSVRLARLIASTSCVFLSTATVVFAVFIEQQHKHQTIELGFPSPIRFGEYPLLQWTPIAWYEAMLRHDLTRQVDRQALVRQLMVARFWVWNLIPMIILGAAACIVVLREATNRRRVFDPQL